METVTRVWSTFLFHQALDAASFYLKKLYKGQNMILFYSQALLKFSHKINLLSIWQKVLCQSA